LCILRILFFLKPLTLPASADRVFADAVRHRFVALHPARITLRSSGAAASRFSRCDISSRSWKRVTGLTLRRTYSSWAHEKGVPGKVVAQLMGHAKVDTTLNVYTQVIDGALRTAVDKVRSELFTIVHKSETGAELTHCVGS
jgi:integrase